MTDRDPLSSANDRWTGDPEMDRAMLVARSQQAMSAHRIGAAAKHAEIDATRDVRRVRPDREFIAVSLGVLGLLVFLIIFVCILGVIST